MRYVRTDTAHPATVDAVQVPDGEDREEVERLHEWCEANDFHLWESSDEGIVVHCSPEPLLAPPGTWVVKSPNGRFRLVGAYAFSSLYTPLN